jgi:outer membrane lipoprotein
MKSDRVICIKVVMMVSLLAACASRPSVIPPALDQQIDRSIAFPQLLAIADSYRGQTVLLGGEVLAVSRMPDATQIEFLQLPTHDGDPPAESRRDSQGRFLGLIRDDNIDSTSLPPGTRVTVVGEVTGVSVQPLDDSEYRYPTVAVKHLHIWKPGDYRRRRSSPLGNFFSGLGLGLGSGAMTPDRPESQPRFGGVGLGGY